MIMACLTIKDPKGELPPITVERGIIQVHGENLGPGAYLVVSLYERGVSKQIATVPQQVRVEVSV
jgi:hypothetical protein